MKAQDLVRGWALRECIPTIYPSFTAPNFVNTPAGAAAWVWSPYQQIVAATANDFSPFALFVNFAATVLVTANVAFLAEYEIATGAAGAEVPYATFHYPINFGMSNPGATTTAFGMWGDTLPIGPTIIPAGTRIAHRIRFSDPATNGNMNMGTYIGGFDGGKVPPGYRPYDQDPHWRGIHRAVSKVSPAGGTVTVTPNAVAWAWGAWVQVIASAPMDLLVTGIVRGADTRFVGAHLYAELGTGGAGSEISRGRLGFPMRALGSVGLQRFLRPIYVQKGERVALRVAGSSTAPTTMTITDEEV